MGNVGSSKEKRIWATREKEIKADEKNRKKASKHQRRSGSKKKTNEIDLGKWKINVKHKVSS